MKKYLRMSSAAVMIGAIRVNNEVQETIEKQQVTDYSILLSGNKLTVSSNIYSIKHKN